MMLKKITKVNCSVVMRVAIFVPKKVSTPNQKQQYIALRNVNPQKPMFNVGFVF